MSDSKSEYASGFSGPAALHLAAAPSPRHEGNVGQAPRLISSPALEGIWVEAVRHPARALLYYRSPAGRSYCLGSNPDGSTPYLPS